jgi:hypothetical protein
VYKYVHLVSLIKLPNEYLLEKSASIQPRTSFSKFGCDSIHFSFASLLPVTWSLPPAPAPTLSTSSARAQHELSTSSARKNCVTYASSSSMSRLLRWEMFCFNRGFTGNSSEFLPLFCQFCRVASTLLQDVYQFCATELHVEPGR